jgi:protein-ribulosamine 3-kinase
MPDSSLRSLIQQKLKRQFPVLSHMIDFTPVGGGSINQTYRLSFSNHSIFCKVNSASKFPHLLLKESNGLDLIKKQGLIKVPDMIDCFEAEGIKFYCWSG